MVALFERIVGIYKKEYGRNPVLTLFLTILIAFFTVFVAAAIATGGDTFYYVLNSVRTAVFSDHFESVWASSDGPYTKQGVIYPPFVVVLYAIIGHFVIPYADVPAGPLSLEEAGALLRDTQMGLMSFLMITLVTVYVLYLLVSKIMKGVGARKELVFFFAVLMAYPFIYAVERGNSIILALVFCLLFILGYRSENKFVRYASYIALGCAVGIKLYPALLALLVLRERDYKGFAICTGTVAALSFVPFIFTDGGPFMLFDNIFSYSGTVMGFTNITQITTGLLHEIMGFSQRAASIVGYAILGIFTLLSFIIILFDREMKFWKVLALIGCNLILGFGLGIQYQVLYLLPAMLYFLAAEKDTTRENKFYTVCFAMTIVLIPGIVIGGSISTSAGSFGLYPSAVIGAIGSVFVIAIAVALLLEGILRLYRSRRAKAAGTAA